VNPIQPVNVEAWMNIHGVADLDDRRRYYEFVSVLDRVFLEWNASKEDKEKNG